MLLKLYMKSSKLFMILTIVLNVVDAQDELERMTHPMEHAPAEVFLKILLVEFSDVSHDINYSGADFDSLFFSTEYYITDTTLAFNNQVRSPDDEMVFGSLRDYYLSMSNGQFSLIGEIINNTLENGEPDWLMLDSTKIYHNSYSNSALFNDIQIKADEDSIDYSIPNDSTKLVIIYAGNRYSGALNPTVNGIPGTWYPMSEKYDQEYTGSESDAATFSNIGIHVMEFLHLLGLTHSNDNWAGRYCGMNNNGITNGPTFGACPAPLNPYYRNLLGWLDPIPINSHLQDELLVYNPENTQSFVFTASSYINSENEEEHEFYIIENKHFSGIYDSHIPFPDDYPNHTGGLLIWHGRLTIFDFFGETAYSYNAKLKPANGEIVYSNGIDNYDVFYPGDNNEWSNVNDFTIPSNTNLNNGEYSHFAITNIQLDTETLIITADFHPNYYSGSFSGVISSDVTFAGNVFVDGDVTVESGGRLIIEPNTTVAFSEDSNLKIYGETIINGEEGEEVVFTSESGDYNIIAYQGSKVSFNHVRIENADRIELWNQTGETTFTNCTFDNNSFVLAIEGHPQFYNCQFRDNQVGLITVSLTYPVAMATVENCTFENNELTGMLSGYRSIPILKGNEFVNNPQDGLRVSFGSQPYLFTNGADCSSQNNYFNNNDIGVRVHNSGLPWLGIYVEGLPEFEGYNRFADNVTKDVYSEDEDYFIYAQKNHWQYDVDNPCDSGNPIVSDNVDWFPTISDDGEGLVHSALQNEVLGDYILAAATYVALVMENPDAGIVKWAIAGLVRTYTKLNRRADLLTLLEQIAQDHPETIAFKYASTHQITQLIDFGNYEEALEQILLLEGLYPQSELSPKHLFEEWIIAEKTGGLSRSGLTKVQIADKLINEYPEDDFGITMSFIQGTVPTTTNGEETTISNVIPESFRLYNAYPNPFNPITNITYELPEESHITISIYDLTGRKLEDLVSGTVQAGRFNTTWNAEKYSSGVYLVNMSTPSYTASQKVVLLK